MGNIKGFLFAVRHREILMTDLGLLIVVMNYIPTPCAIMALATLRNPATLAPFT